MLMRACVRAANPGDQFVTCKFTFELAIQVATGSCLLTSLP